MFLSARHGSARPSMQLADSFKAISPLTTGLLGAFARPVGLILLVTIGLTLVGCSDGGSDSPNGVPEFAVKNIKLDTLETVQDEPSTVVVYSSRKEHLIKPLFDQYTNKTGVEIKYITDSAGPLIARMKAEGKNSPVDLFITVDAGNLWYAAKADLLRSADSEVLNSNVSERLRDVDNRWFGLSERARTIVYSTERVQPSELSTYEALSENQFKGRLCLRTSKKVYNQSLVATLIHRLGEEATQTIVEGWVKNLATDVFSNDTKTMEAILAGQCDVAIVNTYYFARLQEKQPEIALKLFWPNQTTSGVHVNISGAGIARHAKHPKQAIALLEWLSSAEAQATFAQINHEYPILETVDSSDFVAAWGEFKRDPVNVGVAGQLQTKAVKLMDRAGYR